MSELQDNLLNIKQEKDTKILPQNIRRGVTVYNITGTLEGGGSVEGVKQFNSMQEMQADPSPSDGDLATVYTNSQAGITADSEFQIATFPQTVVLSSVLSAYVNVGFQAVDQSIMFDCMGSLDSQRFNMDCYTDNGDIRIQYESQDGLTYIRTRFMKNDQEVSGDEMDFDTIIKYGSRWGGGEFNSVLGNFILVGSVEYSGLYKYGTYKTDDFRAYDLANCVYDPVQSKITEVPEMPNRISHTAIQEVLNLIDEAEGKENHNAYGTICIDKNFDNLLIGVADNNGTFVQAVIALFNNKLYLCRSNSSGVSMRLFNYNLNTKVFSELSLPQETLDFQRYSSTYTGYRLDAYAILQGSYEDYQRQRLDDVAYYTNNSQAPACYEHYYPIYYYEDKYAPAPTQLSATQETVYEGTFYGKNGVQEGNLSNTNNLNIPKVRNRVNLYNDLSYLELNENVTNLSNMFNRNESLTTVPIIQGNNVLNMYNTFNGCYNLREVSAFYCNNVTNIETMFNFCNNLSTNALSNIANSLPYANQVNTTIVYTTGISANRFGNYDKDILYNKGYLDCDRNTVGWDTQYNINGTLYSRGDDFDRYGIALRTFVPTTITSVNISNVGTDNGILLDMSGLFYYKSNLSSINIFVNTSNVTNTYIMFGQCIKLTSVLGLNTSNVVNMQYMFGYCRDLMTAPNLDTSNVVYMRQMFYGCGNLTSVPNFNTSNVVAMQHMFGFCGSLTTVPNFNTINVMNMYQMFWSCQKLTSVPNFNTSNVVDMGAMFGICYNLTTVPNFNTANVTNMYNMFSSCINLTSVPDFDTSNVVDISGMFLACYNLTTTPNFNTSNVTDMHSMFQSCNNLATVYNFNTSNVVKMNSMFDSCFNLISVPNFDTSNVISMSYMFANCNNLATVSQFNTNNVTDMRGMFSNCNNLTTVPNFNTSNVIDISRMFERCFNLMSVPNFDTSNVTNMADMFQSCQKLTVMPNFNMNNVIDTYMMFWGCSTLANVEPLANGFHGTNISRMFSYCYNLTSVPNFDTSNVDSMYCTFNYCYNLVTVPQFDTSNVTDMTETFARCNNLSDASIQNIINMCLNSNIPNDFRNMSVNNMYSPFRYSNITSSRYSNRLTELNSAGWSY